MPSPFDYTGNIDPGVTSEQAHEASDLNQSPNAQHHTIGHSPNNALPGDNIILRSGSPVGTHGFSTQICFDIFTRAPLIDMYVYCPIVGVPGTFGWVKVN